MEKMFELNEGKSHVWSKHDLFELVRSQLQGYQLLVVSNREPYVHRYIGNQIECVQPASGLTAALDPIVQACGGAWIAHGSGNADRKTVDTHDRVRVPPSNPTYTLRRVWLSKEQENGYYYGLANEGLWPLCHIVFAAPKFDPKAWEHYRQVNAVFARAVLEEAGDKPTIVFIQDYHFGLLPRMLKNSNDNLIVAQFWHIPWPNRETFRVFPWGEELLDGLLGNDMLGFHLRYHCQNFLETVDRHIEAKVDMERFEVTRGGRSTVVRPFPISIDFEAHSKAAEAPAVKKEMARCRKELGLAGKLIGVGMDRIDYTKGIPNRLRALDLLLEQAPEYRGKLVFIQVGVPSRTRIALYQAINEEINELVEEINWRWSEGDWRPVVFIKEHASPLRMMALHRLAHFCMVTSLHDGMNLVAKEFVASRGDEDGVLILSKFTGSARELTDALLVNPFSLEELANSIRAALSMTPEERRWRMQRMRETVAMNNVYRWAASIISSLLRIGSAEKNQTRRLEQGE